MNPTPEQMAAFGEEARRLRKNAGRSAEDIATALTARLGESVSYQSVTAWERGEYPPRKRETAQALDDELEAGGMLLGLLLGPPDVLQRIENLEAEMLRVAKAIRTLDGRLKKMSPG